MSTFGSKMCKCAICGEESEHEILMSTNTFGGSMDLDTRPPEMYRSTMFLWVQECPFCGYVSGSISDESTVAISYLKGDEYKNCNGMQFGSYLAKRFYKNYMINQTTGNKRGAFWASLRAAWASDDERDADAAVLCRKQCLELVDGLENQMDEDSITIMKVDLLRRTGQFEKAIELCQDAKMSDDLLNNIIKFEMERAKAEDDRCYTIDSAK